MPEKITYDDAANNLTHSFTKVQKDLNGADVTNETRIDHYGSAISAARRDSDFEDKLSKGVKDKITARVERDRADGEAAAAAALQAIEAVAEDPQ